MEKDKVLEHFKVFDKNGDGIISRVELMTGFQEFCKMLSIPKGVQYDKAMNFFNQMDVDSDGTISFEEFEIFLTTNDVVEMFNPATAAIEKPKRRQSQVCEVILANQLDSVDLKQRVEEIFQVFDVNEDGMISKVEFLSALHDENMPKDMLTEKMKLFCTIDLDGSNKISKEELEEYLMHHNFEELFEHPTTSEYIPKGPSLRWPTASSNRSRDSSSLLSSSEKDFEDSSGGRHERGDEGMNPILRTGDGNSKIPFSENDNHVGTPRDDEEMLLPPGYVYATLNTRNKPGKQGFWSEFFGHLFCCG